MSLFADDMTETSFHYITSDPNSCVGGQIIYLANAFVSDILQLISVSTNYYMTEISFLILF